MKIPYDNIVEGSPRRSAIAKTLSGYSYYAIRNKIWYCIQEAFMGSNFQETEGFFHDILTTIYCFLFSDFMIDNLFPHLHVLVT